MTDLRCYAKQLALAKTAECPSWIDNEVSELIGLKKHKCRNYVTGRWVLTIKLNKFG